MNTKNRAEADYDSRSKPGLLKARYMKIVLAKTGYKETS
jgi:hypothetical protein